jgi:DNA replication protein DnaC
MGEERIPVAQPSYGYRKRGDKSGDSNFNGAIYGDYGVGKTYLAGTIEEVMQQMTTERLPQLELPAGVTCRFVQD